MDDNVKAAITIIVIFSLFIMAIIGIVFLIDSASKPEIIIANENVYPCESGLVYEYDVYTVHDGVATKSGPVSIVVRNEIDLKAYQELIKRY